jgi:hypothetical protein
MNKITVNISQKESELLDAILKKFGNGEHLSREEILPIFDSNENLAADHIDILSKLNYIRKIAEIEGSRLGLAFYKETGVDLFLSKGGFTGRYNKELEAHRELEAQNTLQHENLHLQNESLKHQGRIRDQENTIRNLDEKLKRFEMVKNYEWLLRLAIGLISGIIAWSLK